MRVLFVLSNLKKRSGMVLHVRDLALELLRRGHTPVVFSPSQGLLAEELRSATVSVPTHLDQIESPPDIIHGHTHVETMVALLRFPGVPVVSTCHGFASWQNAAPPLLPRIRRYVSVDDTTRDRLLLECGIPASRISVQLNFVDLARFPPRMPLPPEARRAVVFSNDQAFEHLPLIEQVCREQGLTIDRLGGVEHAIKDPGARLGDYDLAFAKGRSALEAASAGLAVVICGPEGLGPMASTANYATLRRLNFGLRSLRQPVTAEVVRARLADYDAADAGQVSARLRAEGGLEDAVDRLLELYATVIDEHRRADDDPREEARVAGAYLLDTVQYYRQLARTESAAASRRAAERQGARVRERLVDQVQKARRQRAEMAARVRLLEQAAGGMKDAMAELRKALTAQRRAAAEWERKAGELRQALNESGQREGGLVARVLRRARAARPPR